MNKDEIFAKLKIVVAREMIQHEEKITQETLFRDDLGADTSDINKLVLVVEDEFSVGISWDEESSLRTVKDLLDCILLYKGG